MTSIRNNPVDAGATAAPPRSATAEALLDAALASVLAVGVRRTTMTDVARRAGISRMTAYRAYPDVRALVADLLTREFGALLAEVGAGLAPRLDARARLVEATVRVVERLPRHELFRRVVEVDPELLLPYVVERLGATQLGGLALVDGLLREGQRDGSVRRLRGRDREVAAYCVLLAMQSFVLASAATERRPDAALVPRELRRMLDGYLAPGRAS